ncbi:MAG TPA: hypothetical protein VF062_02405 [Candidatus Limnocylindrales bacterium]
MGVLYDYFHARDTDAVVKLMAETGGHSPLTVQNRQIDAVEAKGIDPTVSLGQVIAMILDLEWSTHLVPADAVWPADLEWHEGPWVLDVGEVAQRALARLDEARIPDLATRWAATEEFRGQADPADLARGLNDLSALARLASATGERLYCWVCL